MEPIESITTYNGNGSALQRPWDAGPQAILWLDKLIQASVGKCQDNGYSISLENEPMIERRIKHIAKKINLAIHERICSASSRTEAENCIGYYHANMVSMLEQTLSILENLSQKNGPSCVILSAVKHCVQGTIEMIERRFSTYMDFNEKMPSTSFLFAQRELCHLVESLKKKVLMGGPHCALLEIVLKNLGRLVENSKTMQEATYREMAYAKELLTVIDKIDLSISDFPHFTELDAVLIYMNFNSAEYMDHLAFFIKSKLCSCSLPHEWAMQLSSLQKSFNQLHQRQDIVFDKRHHSIGKWMDNWFLQEWSYISNTLDTGMEIQEKKKQKVLCKLSTDQIGLILRAAYDQGLLESRSLNDLFRAIVPHLSTGSRENLSFDSMRSKTYAAEKRDINTATEALRHLIDRIRDF